MEMFMLWYLVLLAVAARKFNGDSLEQVKYTDLPLWLTKVLELHRYLSLALQLPKNCPMRGPSMKMFILTCLNPAIHSLLLMRNQSTKMFILTSLSRSALKMLPMRLPRQ
ncbi:hypothetical protein EBT25_08785 [bacterium]|nr:hypothetical protein [bacterium]